MASIPLKNLAYYRTGGTCKRLYMPSTIEELARARKEIASENLPYFFLGGGTNSLVMDEPWPGAVIAFLNMTSLKINGTSAYVEAGIDNTVFAEAAYQKGLSGAAWMNRLPGQMGGTVRMNARCYGGEISQIVTKVITVTKDGTIKEYTDPAMFRGYKDTIFMTNEDAVAAVEINLQPGDPKEVRALMDHCAQDREGKGQFMLPSCGCAFKNMYEAGVPSGMLLQAAGVYMLSHPALMINPHHANFVFNKGAPSRAIIEFTLAMRERVYSEFGVWLDYEMEILGHVPNDLKAKIQEKRPHRFQEERLAPLREKFRQKTAKA